MTENANSSLANNSTEAKPYASVPHNESISNVNHLNSYIQHANQSSLDKFIHDWTSLQDIIEGAVTYAIFKDEKDSYLESRKANLYEEIKSRKILSISDADGRISEILEEYRRDISGSSTKNSCRDKAKEIISNYYSAIENITIHSKLAEWNQQMRFQPANYFVSQILVPLLVGTAAGCFSAWLINPQILKTLMETVQAKP